jgi:two-component system KDP operon response regulator KdpE
MTAAPLVLIVDDEPAIRRLLRTSLAAQGYRTLEAASGAEALAALGVPGEGREAADVVLLDLGLPDIDGLDVIRRLRAVCRLSSLPRARTNAPRWRHWISAPTTT